MTETVAANPVSATAYWTLAARHADATGPRPIANDTYAERFMDDTARTVAARTVAIRWSFPGAPTPRCSRTAVTRSRSG